MMFLDKVKDLAKDRFLSRVSKHIADASPETLAKMWGLFERVASNDADKREARRFRWLVEQNHPFGRWLERVSNELNTNAKKNLIENLYGNAWFLNRSACEGLKCIISREKEGRRVKARGPFCRFDDIHLPDTIAVPHSITLTNGIEHEQTV